MALMSIRAVPGWKERREREERERGTEGERQKEKVSEQERTSERGREGGREREERDWKPTEDGMGALSVATVAQRRAPSLRAR